MDTVRVERWSKVTPLDDEHHITSEVQIVGTRGTVALSRDLAYRLLTEAGYTPVTEEHDDA